MKLNNIIQEPVTSDKKSTKSLNKPEKDAKLVVLQPIGYPFLCNLVENPKIEIFDKELFELYAPHPDNSKITDSTSILLMEVEEVREIKRIESTLTMEDVIGQERAKDKCKIIMKYLQDPEHFGDWAPRNVLFHGTPGTGKTMLAKSLSNELKVPLFLIKATSLIGEHVGDGARQIHELFEAASITAPSVVFIDEIDAVGLDRKYQSLRGDVSEVVNALLTRFEEEIEFALPDEKERKAIIELYVKSMPLPIGFDTGKLVNPTKGLSGRDIKDRILKVALHKAIHEDEEIITWKHVKYALKQIKDNKNEPKGMFA